MTRVPGQLILQYASTGNAREDSRPKAKAPSWLECIFICGLYTSVKMDDIESDLKSELVGAEKVEEICGECAHSYSNESGCERNE